MSQKPKYPPPFSLRLTFEERAALQAEAGNVPLGAYIRSKVLSSPSKRRKTRAKRQPVKDNKLLAALLAELGKSHIAGNLNQLAKAVNSGSLPVTPETESAIHQAYEHVLWMRGTIIKALALQEGQE
ncbi:plasmid mobilization relaxosome protein MobC [bacterium]|nr:plasmid mobilization relaxosome protein MobC [bacterium]